MDNHTLQADPRIAPGTPRLSGPSPQGDWPGDRLSPRQCLAPLSHVIALLNHRTHRGDSQVIVRFKNGYGALITDYGRLEGTYEITPLRFHGPGADDYELYFRSHVNDLTWCSERDEMVGVCEQISRLRSPDKV